MTAARDVASYDDFVDPASELDPLRWAPEGFPLHDGGFHTCMEPSAVTTIGDGVLSIQVEQFQNTFDGLPMDNPKHLIFSTKAFPIADTGDVTFSVEAAAQNIGNIEYSFRNAFVSINFVDRTTGQVFDHLVTGRESRAVWEQLFIPVVLEHPKPFSWLVERPYLGVDHSEFQRYTVVFNKGARTVTWFVNDVEVFNASDVDVPDSCSVGLGLMTMTDLVDGKSTSIKGQGMRGQFRALVVPS